MHSTEIASLNARLCVAVRALHSQNKSLHKCFTFRGEATPNTTEELMHVTSKGSFKLCFNCSVRFDAFVFGRWEYEHSTCILIRMSIVSTRCDDELTDDYVERATRNKKMNEKYNELMKHKIFNGRSIISFLLQANGVH